MSNVYESVLKVCMSNVYVSAGAVSGFKWGGGKIF